MVLSTRLATAAFRPCPQAHGHRGHDTIMYVSAAGGCCDCGDAPSWKPEGACARHRPWVTTCAATTVEACLDPAREFAALAPVLALYLRLTMTCSS